VDSTSGTAVAVSFKENGLGNNQSIDFSLDAIWSMAIRCINRGSNYPHTANKELLKLPLVKQRLFHAIAIMLLYHHSSKLRDIPTTLAIYWTIASFSDIYLPYLGILNEIIRISSN